jgi:hypothetical protein
MLVARHSAAVYDCYEYVSEFAAVAVNVLLAQAVVRPTVGRRLCHSSWVVYCPLIYFILNLSLYTCERGLPLADAPVRRGSVQDVICDIQFNSLGPCLDQTASLQCVREFHSLHYFINHALLVLTPYTHTQARVSPRVPSDRRHIVIRYARSCQQLDHIVIYPLAWVAIALMTADPFSRTSQGGLHRLLA